MSDGGLMVIDGSQLRDADLRLPIPDGVVTGPRLLEVAESEAAARLFGLSLPEALRSSAVRRMDGCGDGFLSEEFNDAESLKKKLHEYLLALADELQDDPLVISVLDGSALRLFLDDEDDFAMLAENLFTDLDENDKGKLSKKELQNALIHMGVEMGVPPFSGFHADPIETVFAKESGDLLNCILKKHGAEGEEQLGQAQFAELLQPILQDLADVLAEKHVAVIQHIKVINGSKLKKILDDEKLLDDVIERMFQGWEATRSGEGSKENLQSFLEAKGLEFGLPSSRSHEAVALLYDQIFSSVDEKKVAGDLTRDAFHAVVKDILKNFAQHLEANPVFIGLEG